MSRPQPDMLAEPFTPARHLCACGADGCFGLGPPLATSLVWFCPTCKPADFFTCEPI